MKLIGRKLNSNIFDTGKRSNGNVVKGVTLSNGLNYKDKATGIILPVDTTVLEQTDYEFTHKVDKARATLRFGDNSSNTKKHLFGIENDGGDWFNVKLNLTGHAMSGVQGNKPTFPDSDGLTVEHIPKYNGIKTNYRLGSSGINEITVTFKHNNELTPEQRGNTIVFLRDGNVIFNIKSPYAFDDADEMRQIEPVTMLLGEVGGFSSATLTVDSDWVASAIDPVIDPDVTIEDGVGSPPGVLEDSYLYSNTPDVNTGANIDMHIVFDNRRMILKVDLSDYADITVTSASFNAYCEWSNVTPCDWYRVLKPWGELTSSWNDYDTSKARDIAGCGGTTGETPDREATSQGSATMFAGWRDFSLIPSSVEDGAGDMFSIICIADGEGNSRWTTSEGASNHPYFFMEYEEAPSSGKHFFFNSIPWLAS